MKHWLTTPMLPNDEWVGRQLKNAFDVDETVIMQVKHWKYFDWLAERGSDMEKWVKDADMARHKAAYHVSLSDKMVRNLFHSERRRYLNGKQCPLFISPFGYEQVTEKKQNEHFRMKERELINSAGEQVVVEMPRNYWRYFDWLAEQKVDMVQWVKDADIDRRHESFEMSLNSELRTGLRNDERKRFRRHEPCPGFIYPDDD